MPTGASGAAEPVAWQTVSVYYPRITNPKEVVMRSMFTLLFAAMLSLSFAVSGIAADKKVSSAKQAEAAKTSYYSFPEKF